MKRLRISVEGRSYDVEIELLDESFTASTPQASVGSSAHASTPVATTVDCKTTPPAATVSSENSVRSPLAAVIVSVDVAIGDVVEAGQAIITLEAMKMNTTVSAPSAGTVSAIHVSARDAVEESQVLVTLV